MPLQRGRSASPAIGIPNENTRRKFGGKWFYCDENFEGRKAKAYRRVEKLRTLGYNARVTKERIMADVFGWIVWKRRR